MATQDEETKRLFHAALVYRGDSLSQFAVRHGASQSHLSNVVAGRGSSQRLLALAAEYVQDFLAEICRKYAPQKKARSR